MRSVLRLESLEPRENPSGADVPGIDPLTGGPLTVTPNPIGDAASAILIGVQYPNAAQPGSSATPPVVPTVKPNGP